MIDCDITKPYLFLSYSHKDMATIFPILSELRKRGYRFWYDDGIHLGDEWPETVALYLKEAYGVIFFVSEGFVESKNCRREVSYSIDLDKPLFAIYLDDCSLTPGLCMQLGVVQSCPYKKSNPNELLERVLNNSIFQDRHLLVNQEDVNLGQIASLIRGSLVNSQTIAIGVLKFKGTVLMLRRKQPEGRLVWGFPSSNIKPNENPQYRIVKEFYEETGIHTHVFKCLGQRVHPDTRAICTYFALEYIDGILDNRDDYENAEAKWIPITEYQSYISTNLFQPIMDYLNETPIEVVMCIVTNGNKILLVHRADKDPKLSWAFPGGTVEYGENVFQTAIRELKEETNVDGEIIQLIGNRIHPYSKKHIAYVALKPISFDTIIGDDDLDMCRWVEIGELDHFFGTPVYENVRIYLASVEQQASYDSY